MTTITKSIVPSSVWSVLLVLLLSILVVVVQAESVQFYSCPLFTNVQVSSNTSSLDASLFSPRVRPVINAINNYNKKNNAIVRVSAECAVVPLSLNPDDAVSPKIDVFVKRVRFNSKQDAKKAVWMLGPLETDSTNMEVSIDLVSKMLGQDFDIYTLDTRGNGRSSRLGCAAAQAETPGSDSGIAISPSEWKECYQAFTNEYGDNKQYFSSKSVAIDVATLIQMINSQQETYVYGLAYGSLLVSRLMRYLEQKQLNAIVKGVVMDSIVNTAGQMDYGGLFTMTYSDDITNAVGFELLSLCKRENNSSDLCAQKFGNVDPYTYFHNTIESVYVNHTCKTVSDGIPIDELKAIFAYLLLGSETRVFIPALLYRMNRCDEDLDVATILHIRDYYVAQKQAASKLSSIPMVSPVATANLIFAELFNADISLQQLTNEYNHTIKIGLGESVSYASLYQATQWKPYTLDAEYYNQTFTTTVPTLLINGQLDAETPLWSAQNQNKGIQGPHSLVVLPYASHMTFYDSPFVNGTIPCGMQIMLNFLKMANPDVNTVDTTCAKNMYLNFSGNPVVNELVMGVYDIYEDAYEAPEVEKVVSLYLFIGVEAGTVVLSIIVICCLVYYIVQLKDKQQAAYEDLDQ